MKNTKIEFSVLLAAAFFTLSCSNKGKLEPQTHTCSTPNNFYEMQSPIFGFDDTNRDLEAVVNECVFSSLDKLCGARYLPLIGFETDELTHGDVLSRTFATHEWMKTRFAEMLEVYPDELLQMFRYVTAIVISKDARPSHYWVAHGAIILDPEDLWLSEEERSTITVQEDCRAANFRKTDLGYTVFGLDMLGGALVSVLERSLENQSIKLGTLLAHELAHAMDYTKNLELTNLENEPLFQLIEDDQLLSEKLYFEEKDGLGSEILEHVANFFYAGDEASDAIRSLSAADVGKEFEGSGAVNLYSYYTPREDFAMLVEAHMARKYWNISSDLVVAERTQEAEGGCSAYSMAWSQRNRDLFNDVSDRVTNVLKLSSGALNLTDNRRAPGNSLLESKIDYSSTDLCQFLYHK